MAGVKTEVDVAWTCFVESSVVEKWVADNPKEFEKIANYRVSDGPEPSGIESKFGFGLLAMVNAGKLGDGTYQF